MNGTISKAIFKLTHKAFDWIDREKRSHELHTPEGCKILYRAYTDQLQHRIRFSNVGKKKKGSIGYSMAQQSQRGLAYLIECAIGIKWEAIKTWAITIPQRKNIQPAGPTTTDNEHSLAHALHIRFFEAFCSAIIEEKKPPIVIILSDLGFEDIVYYNQQANSANGWSKRKGFAVDWMPLFYGREGMYEGSDLMFNKLLEAHEIKPRTTQTPLYKLRNSNHVFSNSTINELANHATRHFGYLLLAEAGNNAAHLASIDCANPRLEKALGASRSIAVKSRAGNETQDQFVDLRFAQTHWKRYIQLRNIMAIGINAPEMGLFLLGNRSGYAPYSMLTASSMKQLTLWPNKAPSLQTRAARKHKSVNIIEGSGGNVLLASNLMFATPKTIERHYAFKNRIEAAREMSTFFEAMTLSAQLRYSGVEPVRIIEEGEKIASGHCDASESEGPSLMIGFESQVPLPRCGSPLTCMFCTHFGLHADKEDLVRLLSLKKWIEVQSKLTSKNLDEHIHKFSGFVERIDQIIEFFPTMGEPYVTLLEDASTQVLQNRLDPYWQAKINAIIEVEEV